MADRRAELEKKRLKLQQLRELKEIRQKEKQSGQTLISDLGLISSATGPTQTRSLNSFNAAGGDSISSPIRSDITEVDDILESVGISTSKGIGRSIISNNLNHNHQQSELSSNHQQQLTQSLISPDSGTLSDTKTSPVNLGHPVQPQSLSIISFPQVLIAPKENVTYEKQTQTTATQSSSSSNERGGQLDYYEWDDEFQVLTYDDIGGEEGEDGSLFAVPYDSQTSNDGGGPESGQSMQSQKSHRHHQNHYNQQHHHHHHHHHHQQQQHRTSLPHVEMVRPAQTEDDYPQKLDDRKEDIIPKRLEYKEDERRHLMQTESFRKFLDRAVRITERALSCADSMDIFVDYTGQVESVDSEDKSGLRLSLNTTFVDERWSKGRALTSFDWCNQFPELLVASYNQNEEAPNEPDGICLVWNMKFKKTTPEYIFHCQSAVTSACFAKFHPNLILGGTYSGQIVLWDNRSGKRVPVQRSPLSASAHTHPVYCLKVVGTQNSHNLISISNDGKLCSWSLDMLSAPQETMELCQQKQNRLIAAMSTSFPQSDYNNFVVGSQDGSVFSACRHGAKAGILDIFDGHQGPVTAVDFHSASNTTQVDLSHLFLTCSFDWTFKLWSMREQKPLYSFEDGNDYLYDIRWSPIHPALFATVDGLGKLDIWNLNNDTELPTVSTYVEGMSALNRLIWSPNGQQLVVGDDGGRIAVYDVGEQLAFPKNDEWSRFAHTLQEFTNNSIEI